MQGGEDFGIETCSWPAELSRVSCYLIEIFLIKAMLNPKWAIDSGITTLPLKKAADNDAFVPDAPEVFELKPSRFVYVWNVATASLLNSVPIVKL